MKRLGMFLTLVLLSVAACAVEAAQTEVPDIVLFFEAIGQDEGDAESALDEIAALWQDSYTPLIIDMVRLFGSPIRQRLIDFLERQTGQQFGQDLNRWYQWMWRLPDAPHRDYGPFKGLLYGGRIDERMMNFFPLGVQATIRLDEILWGGVRVNGIPPLDHPVHVSVSEATYLEDDHIVFGVAVNGEARAYPKRILAWHEMALDEIGGVELTIIYCTLCGTVLPYESEVDGQLRKFGTSGLLYRSNKLFFDEATMSLWSTLEGRPVVGRLVGEDLSLRLRSSVTTTWGEWKLQHPDTQVLSIDTGVDRDYGEGVAYNDYFRTDQIMFQVPETDARLKNKDEVLVMLPESSDRERFPIAIAVEFLRRNRIYPFEAAGRSFVVITSEEGANRVYESGAVNFPPQGNSDSIVDESGGRWRLEEQALIAEGGEDIRLPRATANRAFWFGWYAQFPDTELVQ